jgi:Protein of unknown function (DUF1706)
MNKSELLQWLQYEKGQWQALLDKIGPDNMELPGVNGIWTMKDLVAHLTAWNLWHVIRLKAATHGEPEPPPPWPAHLQDMDDINAWIYEANRGRKLGAVLDESQRIFQELFTIVEALPDDVQIEPDGHLVWVKDQSFEAGEFFGHFYDDHELDVRGWLGRVGKL